MTKKQIVKKGLAIDTGLCTLCGTCVAVCPVSNIGIVHRENEIELSFGDRCNDCGICYSVCSGKEIPLKDLDRFVFGREREPLTEVLGIFQGCYQANAVHPEIRRTGASGGVVTALLVYALENKLISGAGVVTFDEEHPWQAKPTIARTREQIIRAANSKYVVVPSNAVYSHATEGRDREHLGCVGLPCHVHSLRKLQWRYPSHALSKKTGFIIGLFCGHNASFQRVEYLLREMWGIESLDEVKSLSYRTGKSPDRRLAEVIKKNGEVLRVSVAELMGGGLFVRERCALCYDWSAEVSDISVGDFWGLSAEGGEVGLGSSTLFVRTETGAKLVEGAVKAGYLKTYPTQVGPLLLTTGFKRKKYGNALRLLDFQKYGWPAPDYQYPVVKLEPIKRAPSSAGFGRMPIEEREKLLRQRGTGALWFP